MVTHSSTSHPVQCLCMAERTGCPVLTDLWSYVLSSSSWWYMKNYVQWEQYGMEKECALQDCTISPVPTYITFLWGVRSLPS
jgi:hypothetical protein